MTDSPRQTSRLTELDLLRFAAALAVTMYHYVCSFPAHDNIAGTLIEALQPVARYGYLGVDLFFLISGFVILWSAQNRSPLDFIVSRAGRLYPGFWAALVLSCLSISLLGDSLPQIDVPVLDAQRVLANATMVPAMLKQQPIDSIFWTLEMEIRFYGLVFLLILFRQMKNIDRWLYIWLATAVICYVADMPWLIRFLAVDPYGVLFITGCLFYRVLANGMTVYRGLALTVSGLSSVLLSIPTRGNYLTPDAISAWVVPGIMTLFLGLFAWLIWKPTSVSTRLGRAVSYRLGALTYPLYLIHGMNGWLLYHAMAPALSPTARVVLVTVLALLVAYVMSVTVETYGRRLLEAPLRRLLSGGILDTRPPPAA